MDNLRFFGLALGLFAAVFFGVKSMLAVEPLKPDARVPTFHRVDSNDPRIKLMQSSESDGDPTRDRLRHEVLDYTKALSDDPCNERLKADYIKAVSNYARAWFSIVPCLRTRSCRNADWPNVERAAEAFGSPLDHRMREAMRSLHAKHIFKPGDFTSDTAFLVAGLTGDRTLDPAAGTITIGPVNVQNAVAQRNLEDVQTRLDDTQPNVCGG